ncbi:Pkinase-domain-containing protein [Russula earlei]|uniref:Pkinase-domain-containing protein n=1 Tax=Russula earlei TaxID=71964 RepID=A0ACC0UDJ7_9AGAM|nr:Pkinase-domain-containing protein [Russula earlei]
MGGFKPIGQASSAVRKFFPGDDDEREDFEKRHTSPLLIPAPHYRPPAPASLFSRHNGHEYPPPRDQDDAGSRDRDFPHAHESELTRPNTPSKSSRDELYSIVSQVGEGTFGKVYKARNTVSGLHVALKRIRMESERDGFPVTAMREIKLLQSLRHDNIVQLYEMMVSNGSVYMVFEYMDHDLTGILSQSQFTFTDAHLKSLCKQMLAGLAAQIFLVNNRGELKLGDFGLARFYHKRRRSDYTNRVITLWYRPPELLYGTTVYGPEVDMWSAGCIMLELFTKRPIFQGNDEIHQLEFIFKILGTPTPERWPGMINLPWYELVKPKGSHTKSLPWLSPAGLDLAEELLAFNPSHRATAVQALEAAYFKSEEPPPAMPTWWHELETKRERAKKRRKIEGGAAH